jgi:DNA-binding SARP family transcriptional activator
LGGFELLDSMARGVPISSRKAEALVALLALQEQRPIARDKVCGLLWPDVHEQQARHSLRQTLLTIRKAMSDALISDERTLALDASCVAVDVVQLQTLLDSATREALVAAADLYRGDLLDGMTLSEQPFEQWLSLERERLRAAMIRGLTRLIELDSDAGRISDAVTACTQLLQLDPLNEQAHRTLMRLQLRQGRRTSALQVYQSFARRLKAEIGVEPEPETKQLYVELESAALVREERRPQPLVAPRAAMSDRIVLVRPHTPEVTRQAELEALHQAFARAIASPPGACVVLGEAGVGKTHLCDRFAREVSSSDVRVLRGCCFESEQVLPFSLWANLISNANMAGDAQLMAAVSDDARAELARLIPDLDAVPPARDSSEPVRLFRAVEALLLQIARSARLLLILEDLHWADEMSLRLLCFLSRRQIGFCVGTARLEEIGSASFLQRTLFELEREHRLTRVPVEPFSREQTRDLAAQWARHLKLQVPSELWADQVWTLSEGNALVIVESARSLAEGAFVDQLERVPVPQRVRVMIHGRVQRVSVAARELLAFATVHDGELPLGTLSDSFEAAQLVAAAEELIEHQLVRANGDSIAFTHVRIREALYDEMLPVRRRLLHARTAAALERHAGPHATGSLGRVGYHYLRAEEFESAIDYLVRFAEQARRGHALGEALAALERAMQASLQLPAAGQRSAVGIDLLIRQAFCLAFLGRFGDLISRLEEARWRVEVLGRPELASPFHFWWGFGLTLLGQPKAAEQHACRALDYGMACDDARSRGYAHGLLSYLFCTTGRHSDGVKHGKLAVEMLWEMTDLPEARVIAAANLGMSHLGLGEWRSALASAQLAASAAEADDSQRGRSIAASLEASVYLMTDASDLALAAAQRAVEASNSPFTYVIAYYMLASAHSVLGETKPAIAILQQIATQLDLHGMRTFAGLTLEGLAHAQLRDGDPHSALASAARAAQAARDCGDPVVLGRALRMHGRAQQATGRMAAARSELGEARELFETVGARLELAQTWVVIAELELAADDRGVAEHALRRAGEIFCEEGVEAGTQKVAALLERAGLDTFSAGPSF